MSGLTPRQRSIFEYVRRYVGDRGYPPSIREIRDAFGLRSNRGVIDHLKALEKKGFIRRVAGISRAIEILKSVGFERAPFEGLRDLVFEVKGDGMTGEHILSGDLVIVQKSDAYVSGSLVAVIVDGEPTVRRFIRARGRIELRGGDPDRKPIVLSEAEPHGCRIIGRVVGVIRSIPAHHDAFSG